MPELPEVETVCRGLRRLIVDKKVVQVTHDTPRSFPNAPSDVSEFVIGATIVAVRRRAKVLMIDLDSQYTLLIHLKMTGQLVFIQAGHAPPLAPEVISDASLRPLKFAQGTSTNQSGELRFGAGHPSDSLVNSLPDKSTRVEITFSDGSKLFFNDQRKFGWMRLYPTNDVPNIEFMRKVGPEPLEAGFTAEQFRERFRRRARTTIKAALLDQTVIAGVGNIYADESLWMAQIHPTSRVGDLPDTKFQQLYTSLREVMNLSIEQGGSSNSTYRDAEGNKGSYMQYAKVFRREGQPCYRCGTIIVKSRVAGRGTHTCPVCQVE